MELKGGPLHGVTLKTTRDNVILDPRQRLFNNFEKVQFWGKFDLLTPMGHGQEFSQRQHVHSRKCLISVQLHAKNQKNVSRGSEDIFVKVKFGPKI